MAALDEMSGHGRAHDAEPDETYLHVPTPCHGSGRGAQISRCPAEAFRRRRFRLVFAADPARVPVPVELIEPERIIDLSSTRLVSPRIVGNLNVRDAVLQPPEGAGQLSAHSLLMIEVILQKEIARPDLAHEGFRLIGSVEPEARN